MTFLPTPSSGDENFERESNPTPEPLYTYLSASPFLANLIPINKQPYKENLVFKSCGDVSNS